MTNEAAIDPEGARESFGATVALARVDPHADAAGTRSHHLVLASPLVDDYWRDP